MNIQKNKRPISQTLDEEENTCKQAKQSTEDQMETKNAVSSNTATSGSALNTDGNPNVEEKIQWFLRDYYKVFDSDDRRALIGAYHADSQLTLSVIKNPSQREQPAFPYNSKKVWNKYNIVQALVSFPKTQHVAETLQVKEIATSPHFFHISTKSFKVTGIFREIDTNTFRYFERKFVTSRKGEGLVIIADGFMLTNPGEEHLKTAHHHLQAMLMQEQMVADLMSKTQMNAKYSHQCLSECGWDFGRAQQSFTMAMNKGLVPAEAFKKQ